MSLVSVQVTGEGAGGPSLASQWEVETGLRSAPWYPALLPSSACRGCQDVSSVHSSPGAWLREVTTGLQVYPAPPLPDSHTVPPVQVMHGMFSYSHHWHTWSMLCAWLVCYGLVVVGSLLLTSELAFFQCSPRLCAMLSRLLTRISQTLASV